MRRTDEPAGRGGSLEPDDIVLSPSRTVHHERTPCGYPHEEPVLLQPRHARTRQRLPVLVPHLRQTTTPCGNEEQRGEAHGRLAQQDALAVVDAEDPALFLHPDHLV